MCQKHSLASILLHKVILIQVLCWSTLDYRKYGTGNQLKTCPTIIAFLSNNNLPYRQDISISRPGASRLLRINMALIQPLNFLTILLTLWEGSRAFWRTQQSGTQRLCVHYVPQALVSFITQRPDITSRFLSGASFLLGRPSIIEQ